MVFTNHDENKVKSHLESSAEHWAKAAGCTVYYPLKYFLRLWDGFADELRSPYLARAPEAKLLAIFTAAAQNL